MRVKKEGEKANLKLNIKKKKKKLRSWHLILSLHGKYLGKQWKQGQIIFLGPKINVDGDCSHEIKRCLVLGRKAMTNLDSVLKSRDITLPTKFQIGKGVRQGCILSPCLFNLMQSTSCTVLGWMTHKLE